MKPNHNAATLRPVDASTAGGQRALLSRGELICRLRDVHRYWSTPRISDQEIEELERQNLIQRSTTDICAIRLTEQGAVVKNGQPLNSTVR
jgi:hypothetical protein